jgi:hypothetical protein
VHPVTGAWSPSGTGHPPTGGSIAGASFAHGYVAFGQSHSACPVAPDMVDLGTAGRDLVQGWVRGGANNGLAVKATRSWKKFTGVGTANPPRLFVTHTPYDASYRIERGVPQPPAHRQQDGKVRIAVTNRGSQTWTPAAYKPAYRAFTAQGRAVDSRVSAVLPRDVPPGDTVTLDATVYRFANAGDYLLDFSMVHNGTFFTDEQIPPARHSGDDVASSSRRGSRSGSSARRYGDDAGSNGRRYGDDAASGGRRYGDDAAGSSRRNVSGYSSTAAREAAQAAAKRAAAAAATGH